MFSIKICIAHSNPREFQIFNVFVCCQNNGHTWLGAPSTHSCDVRDYARWYYLGFTHLTRRCRFGFQYFDLMKDYSRNVSCAFNLISTIYLLYLLSKMF